MNDKQHTDADQDTNNVLSKLDTIIEVQLKQSEIIERHEQFFIEVQKKMFDAEEKIMPDQRITNTQNTQNTQTSLVNIETLSQILQSILPLIVPSNEKTYPPEILKILDLKDQVFNSVILSKIMSPYSSNNNPPLHLGQNPT